MSIKDTIKYVGDLAKKFDPDQPRDEKGRFPSSAGGGLVELSGTEKQKNWANQIRESAFSVLDHRETQALLQEQVDDVMLGCERNYQVNGANR